MFKLSLSETYTWPVQVKLPVDGGKFLIQTFDAVFKRGSQTHIKELLAAEGISDVDFSRDVLVGWKGITDDAGNEVPFSEGARDRLLDVPAVSAAIVEAFVLSASGQAKRKN